MTTIPSGFNGLGVLQAVANVNGPLRAFVLGQDPINQQDIDRGMIALDGTENKAKFGANAILGVSMAVLRASTLAAQLPLYRYIKERYDRERPYLMPIPFAARMRKTRRISRNIKSRRWVRPISGKPFVGAPKSSMS